MVSPSPEPKAERVRTMFDRIAPRYDLLNSILSLGLHHGWRRRAAALCRLHSGDRALDVATGTGDLALVLARHVGNRGQVVGCDFSERMLALGRVKVTRRRQDHIVTLEHADAEALPYPDDSFAAAASAFAGRNVTHLDRMFGEMERVVRPGGRVVFLELSLPRVPGLRQSYRLGFRLLAPVLGTLFARDRDAYTYLPESIASFPGPQAIAAVMEASGLEAAEIHRLALGVATIHAATVP